MLNKSKVKNQKSIYFNYIISYIDDNEVLV